MFAFFRSTASARALFHSTDVSSPLEGVEHLTKIISFMGKAPHSIPDITLEAHLLVDDALWKQFFKAVKRHHSLQSLNLNDSLIDLEGTDNSASLARALQKHPSLKTLLLRDNAIADAGALKLVNALSRGVIEEMNLSRNKLSVSGQSGIFQRLYKSRSSIETLLLHHQNVSCSVSVDDKLILARSVSDFLSASTSIDALSLDAHLLADARVFDAFLEGLDTNRSLCHFSAMDGIPGSGGLLPSQVDDIETCLVRNRAQKEAGFTPH